MRLNARHLYRYVLVGGALVALSCVPSGAWAQQNGSNNPDPGQFTAQDQGQMQGEFHWDDWVAFNQFLDAHPDIDAALRANPDLIYDTGFLAQHPDLGQFCQGHPGLQQDMNGNRDMFRHWFRLRRQLGDLSYFFEQHPDIEKQLEANPGLIDDKNFVQDHPALLDFLSSHPELTREFRQNPRLFMDIEIRFQIRLRDRTALFQMHNFFDEHPNIEKELAANPKLIDDQNYLQDHPVLQQFLNTHPDVRITFDQNPVLFMDIEANYRPGQYRWPYPGNGHWGNGYPYGNPSGNMRVDVASMDQFLSAHGEIAAQLQANPSLINNAKYLGSHPELRNFLNNNPQVRQAFTQNPSDFFNNLNQGQRAGNGTADVVTMDAYLDKHPDVARELEAYPARINDSDYLAHHKDLEGFLKKHPNVQQEFTQNPSAFMRQESAFDACAQMDDFLNAHKNIGKELDQNPASVKETAYLDQHKDLRSFLTKNPGVSDQMQSNPSGFMDQEKKFEANREMDSYLTNHKSVAKDLQKNPDDVKDAKYLDHHKDLKAVLIKNPELEQAANTSPSAFMQEQMKFHEDYKSQQIQQKTRVEQRATTHGGQ
jgi:hypothetical protein